VTQGPTTIVVEIEIPGVSPKNVSLEIIQESSSNIPVFAADSEVTPDLALATPEDCRRSSYLVIRGVKHCRWSSHRVYDERGYGLFERRVFLGYNVLSSSPIKANCEDGVLTVLIHAKSTVFRRQMIESSASSSSSSSSKVDTASE